MMDVQRTGMSRDREATELIMWLFALGIIDTGTRHGQISACCFCLKHEVVNIESLGSVDVAGADFNCSNIDLWDQKWLHGYVDKIGHFLLNDGWTFFLAVTCFARAGYSAAWMFITNFNHSHPWQKYQALTKEMLAAARSPRWRIHPGNSYSLILRR